MGNVTLKNFGLRYVSEAITIEGGDCVDVDEAIAQKLMAEDPARFQLAETAKWPIDPDMPPGKVPE